MFWKYASRLVASKANAVIIVSELLNRYISKTELLCCPGWVDLDLFRPLNEKRHANYWDYLPNHFLVLFVGNPIRPEKRYWLAESVIQLLKGYFNIELINADDKVPQDKMPLYMNASNALLVTSSSEGSPIPWRSIGVQPSRCISRCGWCTSAH